MGTFVQIPFYTLKYPKILKKILFSESTCSQLQKTYTPFFHISYSSGDICERRKFEGVLLTFVRRFHIHNNSSLIPHIRHWVVDGGTVLFRRYASASNYSTRSIDLAVASKFLQCQQCCSRWYEYALKPACRLLSSRLPSFSGAPGTFPTCFHEDNFFTSFLTSSSSRLHWHRKL